MIFELHSHTSEHSSCSHVSAAELIGKCFRQDLQGIVLTDHHYQWPPDELAEVVKKCALPDHFIVLAGQEVRTADYGDVLVYGADVTIDEGTPTAEIIRRFPRAALVLAHPYRNGKSPEAELLLNPVFNAIEIFNSNHTLSENIRGLQDWHRYKFTATGGTDIHSPNYCGTYTTVFDHPIHTMAEFAQEIRCGRCRPSLSETPRAGTSGLQVTELQIGGICPLGSRERIILKSHKDHKLWQSGARTHAIMAAVADHGFRQGPFRVPEPLGQDEHNLVSMEKGVPGISLFEQLTQVQPARAGEYLDFAARWLARLHGLHLKITPANEFLDFEPGRLNRYAAIFYNVKHRHTRRIQEIVEKVMACEREWYAHRPDLLVQGHGDFHPKNIFIGQDDPADIGSRFVAAIDWHSSYRLPPAYDVGTFAAQYENQLRPYPNVLRHAPVQIFIDSYVRAAEPPEARFLDQVALFKARTSLSIVNHLVRVGLGESEDLWLVMLSAEKALIG